MHSPASVPDHVPDQMESGMNLEYGSVPAVVNDLTDSGLSKKIKKETMPKKIELQWESMLVKMVMRKLD